MTALPYRLLMLGVSVLASCTARTSSTDSADAGGSSGLTPAGPSGGTTATPSGDAPSDCSKPRVGDAPLRRLTRDQYDNSIRDLLNVDARPSLGLTADEKLAAFASNSVSPVSRLSVEQYRDVAEDLAVRVTREDVAELTGCDPSAQDAACAERFIARFGRRAFRRPLEGAEAARYLGLFTQGHARGFNEGICLVLTGMLQSPSFVYHLELAPAPSGLDVIALDGYELASRLSFALWSSVPDDELLDAAGSGELSTASGVRAQAERLLSSERARGALSSFHLQWLGLDNLLEIGKDPKLFPEYDAALATAMRDETVSFADFVIRKGDGKLETLLSAPFTVASATGSLLSLYGVRAEPRADGTVGLDPSQRAGLLTQASFLAGHAHAGQTSPVQRGLAVRKNLLCTELPDPPMNVNATPPAPDPNATTRQRFEQHRTDPSCVGCHQLLDPIGVGFESYDAIGRYRATENGLPIDAAGELHGAGDASGEFSGAVQLAKKLATSTEVRSCLQKQWFRFSLGRFEGAQDACSLKQLAADFGESGHDVRALLLSLVASDAFRYRKVQP